MTRTSTIAGSPSQTGNAPQNVSSAVAVVGPTWRRAMIRICVLYTAATLLSSSYGLFIGQTTDTHVHLLLRFGFVVVGIGAFEMYDLLRRRYTRTPAWMLAMAAYILAVAIIMSGMWLWGAAGGELHANAFRDAFLNFTGVGIVATAVLALIERTRGRANPK